MLDFALTDRAKRDLGAARDWYDRQDPRLGEQFLDAAYAAIDVARRSPEAFRRVRGDVRVIGCRRFPYRIHYKIHQNRVLVLAAYHTSRDPSLWDDPNRQ
jgi:plasmid stabilization system protein ParE